ncbi:MAG: histidine triad nucleotide-binding protein [Clostridiales bacterium]|jgi:histidine triad (HIT) family protein|nr:histidine triad nucleotide-binding protein [Clostridiales bacterium]
MNNCVFCSIVGGKIPAEKFYEDDDFIVFADIEPKAAVHYLAVPKIHYALLSDMPDGGEALGRILKKISALAPELGLKNGYRLIVNQGADAGQTVFHLHIHILGGQPLPFADMRPR